MKVYCDVNSANDFNFWSGAISTVEYLDDGEIATIFQILEDLYPEGMSDTELNDFFWFEDDCIAEWLGYEDWEHLARAKDNDCDGHCADCTEYDCKYCENCEDECTRLNNLDLCTGDCEQCEATPT